MNEFTSPLQFAADALGRELTAAQSLLKHQAEAVNAARAKREQTAARIKEIEAAIKQINDLSKTGVPSKERVAKYYLMSRSGESRGHYVEKFSDGTFACTCQGFTFNKHCWAVDTINTGRDTGKYGYLLGDYVFDRQRDEAKAYSVKDK